MTDKKSQRFTIDCEDEGQEVPTLTSLLYRKTVVKTKGSPIGGSNRGAAYPSDDSEIMTLEPTTTIERPLPEEFLSIPEVADEVPENVIETNASPQLQASDTGITLESALPGGGLQIVRPDFVPSSVPHSALGELKGEPRTRRTIPAATAYSESAMAKISAVEGYPSTSFAAAGLRVMLKKPKVNIALVFEPKSPGLYQVTNVLQAPGALLRSRTWSGMEFSVKDFSDLWGRLEKFGFSEFSTLGAAGAGNYDRLAFRSAFQAKGNEWLTLVRVKEPAGKEGLIVFLSEVSIQAYIPTFQTEILAASGGPIRIAA